MTRTDVGTVQATEKGRCAVAVVGSAKGKGVLFSGQQSQTAARGDRDERGAARRQDGLGPRTGRDGSSCPAAESTIIWRTQRTQRIAGALQLHEYLNLVALMPCSALPCPALLMPNAGL
jgi:hypothetical protein